MRDTDCATDGYKTVRGKPVSHGGTGVGIHDRMSSVGGMNMRTGSKFFAWRHAGTAFVLYTISLFVITFGAGAQQQDAVSVSSIVVDPGSPPLVFRPEWRIYRVQVPHAVKSVRVTVTADGAGRW